MNLNKSTFVALILFSVLSIFSCGKKTVVVVDNPTNKMIKLTFENGYELNLEAYGSKRLEFDELKSSVKINNETAENFELVAGKEYILNPLKESYFIEAFEYGSISSTGFNTAGQQTKVGGFDMKIDQIDEQPVIGYFKEFKELLIEKDWDYDLKNTLPEQIEMSSYNSSTTKKKVFRKSTFLSFHKRQGM